MAPRTESPICEMCSVGLDEDPRFWQLIKSRKPYLLPFYYCIHCYTHDSSIYVESFYDTEVEADLALITYLLTGN